MDSPSQQQPVQPVQPAPTPQASAPVVAPQGQPIQATSSTSIGPGHEGEPMPTKPMTEYASQPEMKLQEEVAAAGVEAVNNEQVQLPSDVAGAGVTPANDATPIPADTHEKWPMTPQKADTILTAPHKVFKNSVLWLATLIKKAVKREAVAKEEVAHVSDDS